MLRASAILALLTGLALAVGEVQANWGDWQWWPWWLVDFVAAGLLAFGGYLTLRARATGTLVLGIGWAFTAGMVWMSLAGNVADGVDAGRDLRLFGAYTMLLSALLATSVVGVMLTVAGKSLQSNR